MPEARFAAGWRWPAVAIIALLAVAAGWLWLRDGRQTALHAQTERLSCNLPQPAAAAPHPGMVWVPGGSFAFGDTLYAQEQPVLQRALAGFWIDRTEVTNDEFAEFVAATGYITQAEQPVDARLHPGLPAQMLLPGAVVFVMPNDVRGQGDVTQWWRYVPGANWRHPGGPQTGIDRRGTFPVVTVTLADALAYARWKGRTLPSEVQWEWAARAAQPAAPAQHAQPKEANTWQGLFPVLNSADDGFVGLAPVGCYQPNALGVFDLIGNVWELTADAWSADHSEAVDAAPGQSGVAPLVAAERQHVIKGGSFLCAPNYCMRYRAGARQPQDDDLGASHLGFRTILNAPGA